uniref:Thioredoxin 1 (Trx-1) n=1 Tax=Ganoderma boninense TaxID=34458 RepID=A0A5K1K6Y4_9APHY|nr:Thioredoxin 1 (Trx-1) [Ganoderma boninense]
MPPRKKQKTVHSAHSDSAAEVGQAGNPNTEPSSSTTVPSWKGTKHRRASMEKFIDGPVDIVVEVLALLDPRDLFTLVRTSSVFRNFLLSKCRHQLWKTVIANATGLPPQPSFLSEPAFVHLLYSNHCHNCGTTARHAITEWFKRACPKCIPEVMDYSYHGSSEAYICSKTDLNRYLRQLRNIKKNPDQRKREKAYQAIIKEWTQRLWRRQKHSASLKEWFEKEERNRIVALGDKKAQRFTEIVKRLRESEWAEEIELLSDEELEEMSKLPVVRRSSKLTKGEWSNVLVVLDEFLKKRRDRRLLGEHQVAVRARLGELEKAILEHYVQLPRTPAMNIRPIYIEFAHMEKCKALANAPAEQTVTSDDFLKILPGLHKEWHTSAKTQLVKALKKHLQSLRVTITGAAMRDPLNLAIAVFVCRDHPFTCMRYPAVLAHPCGYTSEHDVWEDRDSLPTWENIYTTTARRLYVDEDDDDEVDGREPFALSKVVGVEDSYVCKVLKPMCAIVRALGLDPANATVADLEACGARLRCGTCVSEGKPDVVYGWEAALSHFQEFSRKHSKWTWKQVHGAELDKVRKLEAARDARPLDYRRGTWACSLCVDWDGSGGEINAHLLNQHRLKSVDKCVRKGTIYVHPAKNNALMRLPVVLAKS